jgi:hypothetical protein
MEVATRGSPWPSPTDGGGPAAWRGGAALRCGGYSGALGTARSAP